MKFTPVFAMAAVAVLSACVTPEETTRAPDPALDPIADKRLVAENGTVFLIRSDGTVGGELGGDEIVGSFVSDGREICSTYTAPERLVGREYCSVPVISGDTVVFNRRDGSKSQPYVIEG